MWRSVQTWLKLQDGEENKEEGLPKAQCAGAAIEQIRWALPPRASSGPTVSRERHSE